MNIDKHHRLPRSKGGSNSNSNISLVRKDLHVAYHKLFGNATPDEVADILNKVWIDPAYKLVAVRRTRIPYQDDGN